METLPYSLDDLLTDAPSRCYPHTAQEAAFLLGGIGTGNISIGARGEFRDWEIFNRPDKGHHLPYSFFAISVQKEGQERITKVLEAKMQPPFSRSHGFTFGEVAGLPHLDSSVMRGEYPFVWVDFEDRELPVTVQLEAFTPFIPLNADDSGIPGAIIRYKVKNTSAQPIDVTIAGSVANAVGCTGYNEFGVLQLDGDGKNEYREEGELKGIFFSAPELSPAHLTYGSMALMTADATADATANATADATADEQVIQKAEWLRGGWFDGIQEFWNDFCDDGAFEEKISISAPKSQIDFRVAQGGSLGICHTLQPGEEHTFEFVLTWYFPNRGHGWEQTCCTPDCECQTEKNYYSTLFSDAWDAGRYLLRQKIRLEGASRNFHRALFSSTLPWYVIDALANNITVIRSPTCFRIEDGTFLAWEGCHNDAGCCEGSCTHVWNYAQTLAFLFPELEHTMRKVEFTIETEDDGAMAFRARRVLGQEPRELLPAADGQMGCIVRLYRDWKLSGNDESLKTVWENAAKALDFAFDYWDSDGDAVLDSQQHNTYDVEFYGPNSLTNSIFFAALKAGAEMAEYLGDVEHAKQYTDAFERGSRKMDDLLWNGEYYVQNIDDVDQYRYQYGTGCLSDQVLGQLLAHVAGLGYILPQDHVKQAIKSVFTHNYVPNFEHHHNVQRTYVLNDEAGLVLCSWPHGGRPKLPFVYSDEVWTGIEYQVAAHLIFEGFLQEGLTLVKTVRERHDGVKRNPWNEVECGHHYARSLSSWALLLALSGFRYDMINKTVQFAPVLHQEHFSTFWSIGCAWGIYRQTKNPHTGKLEQEIEVLYGSLDDVTVTRDA